MTGEATARNTWTERAKPVRLALRGAKYSVVGTMGTAVKLGTLVLLHDGFGAGCLTATALAVECSMIHNFVWHLRWTWRDRSRGLAPREIAARLLRFQMGNGAVALVVNLVSMPLLTGPAGMSYPVAGSVATAAAGVLNFAVSAFCVFTRRAAPAKECPGLFRRGAATC